MLSAAIRKLSLVNSGFAKGFKHDVMTAFTINLYVFLAAIGVFAFYAFKAYRKITSPKNFFHAENLQDNVISLTAANVTLGTGLAYLLVGAQQNGLLMFLIPIMVALGYFLLASFLERVVSHEALGGKNFLASINDQITAKTGVQSHFSFYVSISLIAVYTLALGFEIFASSKIIAALLFDKGGQNVAIILSMIIFLIALFYTLWGGLIAVFGTDRLQLIAILVFLPILFYTAVWAPIQEGQQTVTLRSILKWDLTVLLSVINACIIAVATQFFNLLNWAAVSHVEVDNQAHLLKRVGIFSALIFTLIVAIGVLHSMQGNGDPFSNLMASYSRLGSQIGIIVCLISGLSVFGMTSMVFSTADSLIIAIIMMFYDNVVKRDSKSETPDTHEVRLIRHLVFFCFAIAFFILSYFNFAQPNLFYLLLAIAGSVIVFAPMLATAGYMSSKGETLKFFNNKVVYSYFILFILTLLSSTVFFFSKTKMVGWVGTTAFVVAGLYSMILIFRSWQANKKDVGNK